MVGGLTKAVRRDLNAMERRRKGTKATWQAELALRLAAEIEDEASPLRDRVVAARGLTEAMAALRQSVPAEETKDRLDELAARRRTRKAS